jgi:hypothetical protein
LQLAVCSAESTTQVKPSLQPENEQSPEWHRLSLPHVSLLPQSLGTLQPVGGVSVVEELSSS